MMLRLGRVVAIHPEDNSVDILMTDDGARLAGVQVLASVASTRSGLVDLPIPAQPHDENAKWDIAQATEEDVIAAINDKSLKAKKMGNAYRISKTALEEFLAR